MNRLGLAAILVLALAVRLVGIDSGLPNARHAYPYNPDEWTPMRAFQRMDVRRLDFNPHYFDNPTFFYYLVGATGFAASQTGWVHLRGNEAFFFQHPENIARVILLGRLLVVLFGTATVWLTYLLARRLGLGRGAATLAALFLAIHPSHVVHGHFMTVNSAVTFWTVLTLILALRWLRKGGAGPALVAGAVAGLALSTKYSALLLLIVVATVALLKLTRGDAAARARAIPETAMAFGALIVAFLAGSPYIVLAFGEFKAFVSPTLAGIFGHAWKHSSTPGKISTWVGLVHAYASTPLLLVAALAGAWVLARRAGQAAVVILVWLSAFVGLSLRVAHLASDSRFLPIFPVLAVLAAAAFAAWWQRSRPIATGAAALTAVAMAAWTTMLLGRFLGPMPQELSSDWALANLGPRERVLLTGTATYWAPDIPLREYLHAQNQGSYARTTQWQFVAPDSFTLPYRKAKALHPDVVFLTLWLPQAPLSAEWLEDPDYQVVASFPGKIRWFGRRWHVPLDLYDVDVWVLRPRRPQTGRTGSG